MNQFIVLAECNNNDLVVLIHTEYEMPEKITSFQRPSDNAIPGMYNIIKLLLVSHMGAVRDCTC